MIYRILILGDLDHVPGLWTLLTFHNLELNRVPLLKALVTLRLNCAVMYEDIGAVIASDESESFSIIEPLDGSSQTRHVLFPPCDLQPGNGQFRASCINQVC